MKSGVLEKLKVNQILATMEDDELLKISPLLRSVELKLGDVLYRSQERIDFLYFPIDSIISVIGTTEEGQATEVSLIGSDGAVGLEALLGADSTVYEIVVQGAGSAFRLSTADARDEFNDCSDFQSAVLNFVRCQMAQIGQTAVCNRLHSLDERLARWLLLFHDRAPSDTLLLTQEFLAFMTGATRASVTLAAIKLKEAGCISYTRGTITIADRSCLEKASCQCYEAVKTAETA